MVFSMKMQIKLSTMFNSLKLGSKKWLKQTNKKRTQNEEKDGENIKWHRILVSDVCLFSVKIILCKWNEGDKCCASLNCDWVGFYGFNSSQQIGLRERLGELSLCEWNMTNVNTQHNIPTCTCKSGCECNKKT